MRGVPTKRSKKLSCRRSHDHRVCRCGPAKPAQRLPAAIGDLLSKLGMMCREILGTVVTLPINVSIAAAARAHAAGGPRLLSNTWTQWPTSTKAWAQASPDMPAPMIAMVFLLLLCAGLGVLMELKVCKYKIHPRECKVAGNDF
jgi:hypothetical protein